MEHPLSNQDFFTERENLYHYEELAQVFLNGQEYVFAKFW